MKEAIYNKIHKVNCPCEIRDSKGNLLYYREKKKALSFL